MSRESSGRRELVGCGRQLSHEGSNDLPKTFGDVPIEAIAYESVASYIKRPAWRLPAQTGRHRFYVLRTVRYRISMNERLP